MAKKHSEDCGVYKKQTGTVRCTCMTHKQAREATEKRDLSHLKDFRAVLKWAYDHGLLKGEYPSSDSSSKSFMLDIGEERLIELIDQYTEQKILEAEIKELQNLDFDVPLNKHYPFAPSKAKLVANEIHKRLADLKSQLAKIKEGKL